MNGRIRCRLGFHSWRVSNYPEWQYRDIASYAGTMNCRRCRKFRWMTSAEERAWLA